MAGTSSPFMNSVVSATFGGMGLYDTFKKVKETAEAPAKEAKRAADAQIAAQDKLMADAQARKQQDDIDERAASARDLARQRQRGGNTTRSSILTGPSGDGGAATTGAAPGKSLLGM